ncbi:hypothetical protein SJAV_12970 [Sulfurisphaera javensis]|uniref:Ubiquitin n=1 Tax=Sulfurisphaera javensis TaxID=2049879 RepID=A0AAT9GR61_9CREN
MVSVIFKGPLVSYFGSDKVILNKSYSNINELINEIDKNGMITIKGKIKSGYIILVNGKDYRLFNGIISDQDTVEIIPINHGG